MRIAVAVGLAAVLFGCGGGSSAAPGDGGGAGDAGVSSQPGDDGAAGDAAGGPGEAGGDAGGDVTAPTDAANDGPGPDASDGGPIGAPYPEGGGAHAPYPDVALHSAGGVMTSVKLVSLVASNDPGGSKLLAFGDALVASQWWQTVSAPYGVGAFASHTKLTGAAITGNVTLDAIETYIRSTLTAKGLPAPDAHSLYVLYLPSGVWGVDPGSTQPNTNCSLFGGYHDFDAGDPSFVWAVVQQCPNGGGVPGVSTSFDGATMIASHEIVEATTDPHGDDGWSLDCGNAAPPHCTPWAYVPAAPGEVGDLCAWTVTTEGGYTYTRAWSNAAANAGGDPCVPAAASPYACASTPKDWYTVTAGGSVQIPVAGWSPAAAASWQTYAYAAYDPKQEFTVGPGAYVALDVGGTTTVTVAAPPSATSGDFVVVDVASYTSTEIHPWAVGVYVP